MASIIDNTSFKIFLEADKTCSFLLLNTQACVGKDSASSTVVHQCFKGSTEVQGKTHCSHDQLRVLDQPYEAT